MGLRHAAGRPGGRQKCEQTLPLDIRALHRRRLLQPGTSFEWHWTSDGNACGNIGVSIGVDALLLYYTWSPHREPERMWCSVRFDRTRCHFGGSRAWFRCPWCDLRCAVLYGPSRDGRFGCRRCLRLGYACESEGTLGRLLRRQRKIEARLTKRSERAKWMRQTTYARLCDKLTAVERARNRIIMLSALAFLRRAGKAL